MSNYINQESPYVFIGTINSGKTTKIDTVFSSLIQKCQLDEIEKTNARTLCDVFIEALKNATVQQWRASMIKKKYILIDDFHYLSEKTSTCEELIGIFKSTSAVIVIAMNNHPDLYNFGEDMNQFLTSGTLTSLKNLKVDIFSKAAIADKIRKNTLADKAIISFYTPQSKRNTEGTKFNYGEVCNRVFYVGIPDIDIEILGDYDYTYDSYLCEADELAKFIYEARNDGLDIICQCDFGQSRSAACAAAILEHFEKRGIDIFADYRYYPNQLVYHKVFDALKNQVREQ